MELTGALRIDPTEESLLPLSSGPTRTTSEHRSLALSTPLFAIGILAQNRFPRPCFFCPSMKCNQTANQQTWSPPHPRRSNPFFNNLCLVLLPFPPTGVRSYVVPNSHDQFLAHRSHRYRACKRVRCRPIPGTPYVLFEQQEEYQRVEERQLDLCGFGAAAAL